MKVNTGNTCQASRWPRKHDTKQFWNCRSENRDLNFRLSKHAERELGLRRISRALVEGILQHPEQVIPQNVKEKAYQSRSDFGVGKIYLVRVIVDDTVSPAVVVTVYRTSKIKKYWRES